MKERNAKRMLKDLNMGLKEDNEIKEEEFMTIIKNYINIERDDKK